MTYIRDGANLQLSDKTKMSTAALIEALRSAYVYSIDAGPVRGTDWAEIEECIRELYGRHVIRAYVEASAPGVTWHPMEQEVKK